MRRKQRAILKVYGFPLSLAVISPTSNPTRKQTFSSIAYLGLLRDSAEFLWQQ